MIPDEIFMRRAMELARLGMGEVSPNPMVGCVIVYNHKIIGEGWHKKHGEAHAEVNAITSVEDKTVLSQATLYVNLEPCNHFGKTPPCTDLIIEKKIKKVVIANQDTNPEASGGVRKLSEAGIEVVIGILGKEGRELNNRFFTTIEKKRPHIILKWAQTADGFIAKSNYDSKWISSVYSRQFVHKLRSETDAILIGSKTASHDNPELTTRHWSGHSPTRVVIDSHLRLLDSLKLMDQSHPAIIYNLLNDTTRKNLSFVRLDESKFLNQLLEDLYSKKVQSLLVEGGARTLQLLIDNNTWDESFILISKRFFHSGIAAPWIPTHLIRSSEVTGDYLFHHVNASA
jgi:diaminohydroxyphosphoribosylaminopyrimidine deaminase / 5-amino-6-(5-phosphoribosylamino)uracil reductase